MGVAGACSEDEGHGCGGCRVQEMEEGVVWKVTQRGMVQGVVVGAAFCGCVRGGGFRYEGNEGLGVWAGLEMCVCVCRWIISVKSGTGEFE